MIRHPLQRVLAPVTAVIVTALTACGFAQASKSLLSVTHRWDIGGEGGWDYLTADEMARRLYVSHATRVEVLDLDKGTPRGHIEPTPGVHGIAIAPELHRGYISCGRDSSVIVFDLESLAIVQRIPVPARNPDAILYEPTTQRVFTFNGGSQNTCVLDAATGGFIDTLALGGKPEFAQADGRGKVFVNIEDTSELLVFDARSLRLQHRWPLAPGEAPTGLAMDRIHRRLFAVCGNKTMVVVDADSGRVVTTLPIGAGVDGVVFDRKRGLAIASNGEGTVTIVREDSPEQFHVVETDTTQRGARTLALDERTGAVFVSTASFGPTPALTAERPRPRPTILPGTFQVLVLRP